MFPIIVRRYRATQNRHLLPDLYALLRGEVNKQVHLATKGPDGVFAWPSARSPEYPGPSTYTTKPRPALGGAHS